MAEFETKIKSLQKAMTVLECFTEKSPELGVSEIARMAGIQKSTVHNILSSFAAMGYVAQDQSTGRYRLGLRLMRFSHVINSHMKLQRALQPYMKQIADTLKERVFLGIIYNTDVLYLDCYEYHGRQDSTAVMGATAPLYCTGIGKALLAYTPDPERYLPKILTAYTDDTITDRRKLLMELRAIRERGYATDNMEHEFGIKCVAIPVFGADSQVRFAVSVSGPSLRFSEESIPSIAKCLQSILEPMQFLQ